MSRKYRIYRCVSKKNYLHGKAVYQYERFYVPVPKQYHHIARAFIGKDLEVEVKKEGDGFVLHVRPPPPPGRSIYDILGAKKPP